MFAFTRTGLLLAALALVLGGCQMSKNGSRFTRAQLAVFTSEGFAETPRGWEFSINDKLLFATDESGVLPDQAARIRRVAGRLLQVGIRRAAVEGHADDTGSAEHNQRLSERRAATVAQVLVEAGFPTAAVSAVGLGERFPVEDNGTAAGRRENRRVVILIAAP
ncbi:OmpA family protein [Sphingomonas sp.]|uniref:OmpA family protein n=1 Tax=Sphingomonas sp. TaxID=28214 RepID=UPI0031DC567F